ncbi:MAG: hypothetical protein AAF074_00115 [Pseudomonadota bacterium]
MSKPRRAAIAALFLALSTLLVPAPAPAGEKLQLLMLDQQACEWCEMWEMEVGEIYHLTDEGKLAPLRRARLHAPLPEDVTLARRVHYTPTFVLLASGREIGRIEGYPGEDFFYPMLRSLIARAAKTEG